MLPAVPLFTEYRLKMIDKDGTFVYSQIKNPRFPNASEVVVFPNPLDSRDLLQFDTKEKKISTVNVYAFSGRLRYEAAAKNNSVNTPSLTQGKYVVRIKFENGTESSHTISKK